MGLIVANCFISKADSNSNVDLQGISNIAIASGEEIPPIEGNPILLPTGIVEWFKELWTLNSISIF